MRRRGIVIQHGHNESDERPKSLAACQHDAWLKQLYCVWRYNFLFSRLNLMDSKVPKMREVSLELSRGELLDGVHGGNMLTEGDQWRKLMLVVETADAVWGQA